MVNDSYFMYYWPFGGTWLGVPSLFESDLGVAGGGKKILFWN
jgi:hypothetical protein